MKQDKQDRRSQRTRRLVSSALMELLSEKRFEAITIQDLLDRADIGRSTFYAHYYDKEDVLTSLMEQVFEAFAQHASPSDAGPGMIPGLEVFRHVYQHPPRPHCPAMVQSATREKLWETAQTLLSRYIERSLRASRKETCSPSVPPVVASQYLAGAFLALLKWWLENGMPYPPEQMESIFRQLALSGMQAMAGGKSALSS